jgi:hypothetical protein
MSGYHRRIHFRDGRPIHGIELTGRQIPRVEDPPTKQFKGIV